MVSKVYRIKKALIVFINFKLNVIVGKLNVSKAIIYPISSEAFAMLAIHYLYFKTACLNYSPI